MWRSSAAPAAAAAVRGVFDDPELDAALAERRATQMALTRFVRQHQPQLQAAAREFHDANRRQDEDRRAVAIAQWQTLTAASKRQAEAIMYPGQPEGMRDRYLSAFGCAAWTEPALSAIGKWSGGRVVEIGAGAGHWKRALELRGHAHVTAFDDGSDLPTTAAPLGDVLKGDEHVLEQQPSLNRRALLVVYPPPDDMAAKCVARYSGSTLLYVGEGRGGVNANRAFFDEVEHGWDLKQTVELAPFPGGKERLYVFRRKIPLWQDPSVLGLAGAATALGVWSWVRS